MNEKRQKGLPNYPGSLFTHSLLAIFIIGEALLIIAQAFFLARAITFLFQRMPIGDVLTDIGFFFVAFIFRHTLTHLEVSVSKKFAIKTADLLRNKLLHVYFHHGTSFSQRKGTGHLVMLAMEGVDHVKKYVEIIGIRMIKTAIIPAAIVIYVYFFDPISSVILVVTVPIVVIFMILLGLAAQKMADAQYGTYTRLSNHFIDSLKGLETLTYLGQGRTHAKKIARVSDEYRKATMRTLRVAFLSSFALDFFTSLSIAFVAVGLGFRLIDGSIALLPALTILILAPEYFSPIKQVGKDYHATLDGQIAMSEINALIKTEQETITEDTSFTWSDQSCLTLRDVSVQVDDKTLLAHVSFRVQNGMIGIVGASGAGKSTLIRLLAGRLPHTAGEIFIDDQKVDSLHKDTWLRELAYIPQHPYIFPLTLADNIRFYEPDATDEQVERLITEIGLAPFVESLPNGIHEKIGEGGRTLSGGQEQRIAIARALLSNKPIILLDEPSSHLDIETEYEIKQLILRVFKGKLVFLATHRLHWMKEMDHILMLEDGQVVEQGSDESLLAQGGTYHQFIHWNRGDSHE